MSAARLQRAFHPECVADVAGCGLARTCTACVAEADRCRRDDETVTGYLLWVADAMRRAS